MWHFTSILKCPKLFNVQLHSIVWNVFTIMLIFRSSNDMFKSITTDSFVLMLSIKWVWYIFVSLTLNNDLTAIYLVNSFAFVFWMTVTIQAYLITDKILFILRHSQLFKSLLIISIFFWLLKATKLKCLLIHW